MSKDWSTAYNEFTAAGENSGKKPIVVSYVTSPLETLRQQTELTLNQLVTIKIEYAGVITNAKNKQGAEKFIEFMLSKSSEHFIAINVRFSR